MKDGDVTSHEQFSPALERARDLAALRRRAPERTALETIDHTLFGENPKQEIRRMRRGDLREVACRTAEELGVGVHREHLTFLERIMGPKQREPLEVSELHAKLIAASEDTKGPQR